MGYLKTTTRRREGVTGSLGAIQRSIGYLQGGYKDVNIHSRVQLFNTVTQVGRIVYDTGYQRSYVPGVSGNYTGYFNINDSWGFNKFNYITVSASMSFTLPTKPHVTSYDTANYTLAWITTGLTNAGYDCNGWYSINLATDAVTSYGVISAGPQLTTRQALSSAACAFYIATNTAKIYSFNYITRVAVDRGANAIFDAGNQFATGMAVSQSKGYMVGINRHNRINFVGDTPTAYTAVTPYTYQFGESHSIASSAEGFMMAGYADTSGRYGGSQHGLCQKVNLTTEAVATLPDLVLPQSSGQMMQGF